MGQQQYGIDAARLMQYAEQIKAAAESGTKVAVVMGGGNIFRGVQSAAFGLDPVQGDYMGMLATVINSMSLQSALEVLGVQTRLLSGLTIQQVCEPYLRRRALRHLEKGRVVIFGAGIGSPYFTTDSAASLRAIEIEADVVLKGTRVDGIYTADPEKDPSRTRFPEITFDDVIEKNLNVRDMTAFTLCKENNLHIIVFDMNTAGNLQRLIQGEDIGTRVVILSSDTNSLEPKHSGLQPSLEAPSGQA